MNQPVTFHVNGTFTAASSNCPLTFLKRLQYSFRQAPSKGWKIAVKEDA